MNEINQNILSSCESNNHNGLGPRRDREGSTSIPSCTSIPSFKYGDRVVVLSPDGTEFGKAVVIGYKELEGVVEAYHVQFPGRQKDWITLERLETREERATITLTP